MQTVTTGGEPTPHILLRFWRALLQLPLAYKVIIIVLVVGVVGGLFWTVGMLRQNVSQPMVSAPESSQNGTGATTPSPDGQSSEGTQPSGDSPTSTPQTAQNGGQSGSTGGTGTTNGSSGGSAGGTSDGGGTGGDGDTTPSGTCPSFPAFPSASCTGWQHTGATLQACDTTLNDNNGVYENCLFDGGVVVVGTNITIKRSKITGLVSANWDANGSLRGLTLIDVEIDGSVYADPFGQAAIGLDNYTCIRCNVHHTGRGANFRNNVRIEDSYFHDFTYVDGAHQSGVGSNGGSNNTILHNNIECNGVGGSGCSGAFVMYGDFDPVDNILVQNNLFNTDGSFCTYAGSAGVASGKAYPSGTNIRYIDNRFGKKYYNTCGDLGPVTAWEYNSGNVWTGNAWQDGSGAIVP